MSKAERNITLSIKVSEEEREVLQTRAQNLNMNVSEFIRMATLSSSSKSISIIAENARLNEKIRELEIQQSFNGTIEQGESFIVLSCTHEQEDVLLKLYGNYYKDGRDASIQILNYLIDDAISPHWNFAGSVLSPGLDYPGYLTKEGVEEIPLSISNRTYLAKNVGVSLDELREVFSEFELFASPEDVEELNQL